MEKRLQTKYEDQSSRFLLGNCDYKHQFSHIYLNRLAEMTKLLMPVAQKRWGSEYPVKKLVNVREGDQQTCIIIGTIYKDQEHKPSMVRELAQRNELAPQPPRLHYTDAKDKLILEEEHLRVRMHGNVQCSRLATGVVCAVLGSVENGRLDVEDIAFYEAGPQRPLPQRGQRRLLILTSGLGQVESHNFVDALNLFQHFLAGFIGRKEDKHLVRLIIAGNSVRTVADKRYHPLHATRETRTPTVEAMAKLDELFAAWSKTLPIDVMPGAFDPSNYMLPQQPLHNCMLPKAAKNSSFRSVTNPYDCSVDDVSIVGCSGQNVDDMLRNTDIETRMDALRSTLEWGHIAPTAPDTLLCFPFLNEDPYILRECPHIYFTGNCDKFDTAMHTSSSNCRTRLVCVPSFSTTQSIAVVDLETLDCHKICFHVQKD